MSGCKNYVSGCPIFAKAPVSRRRFRVAFIVFPHLRAGARDPSVLRHKRRRLQPIFTIKLIDFRIKCRLHLADEPGAAAFDLHRADAQSAAATCFALCIQHIGCRVTCSRRAMRRVRRFKVSRSLRTDLVVVSLSSLLCWYHPLF